MRFVSHVIPDANITDIRSTRLYCQFSHYRPYIHIKRTWSKRVTFDCWYWRWKKSNAWRARCLKVVQRRRMTPRRDAANGNYLWTNDGSGVDHIFRTTASLPPSRRPPALPPSTYTAESTFKQRGEGRVATWQRERTCWTQPSIWSLQSINNARLDIHRARQTCREKRLEVVFYFYADMPMQIWTKTEKFSLMHDKSGLVPRHCHNFTRVFLVVWIKARADWKY